MRAYRVTAFLACEVTAANAEAAVEAVRKAAESLSGGDLVDGKLDKPEVIGIHVKLADEHAVRV